MLMIRMLLRERDVAHRARSHPDTLFHNREGAECFSKLKYEGCPRAAAGGQKEERRFERTRSGAVIFFLAGEGYLGTVAIVCRIRLAIL